MEAEQESKVAYDEDETGRVRVIRGVIDNSDPNFLIIKRRDGEFRIAKRLVRTIECWNGGVGERK